MTQGKSVGQGAWAGVAALILVFTEGSVVTIDVCCNPEKEHEKSFLLCSDSKDPNFLSY